MLLHFLSLLFQGFASGEFVRMCREGSRHRSEDFIRLVDLNMNNSSRVGESLITLTKDEASERGLRVPSSRLSSRPDAPRTFW